MIRIETLYFSDSVLPRHHRRIEKQLSTGNKKMKRDFLVLVVPKNSHTICELISFDEYAWWMVLDRSFALVGAVTDQEDFETLIVELTNRLLEQGQEITTENLQKELLGDCYYELFD